MATQYQSLYSDRPASAAQLAVPRAQTRPSPSPLSTSFSSTAPLSQTCRSSSSFSSSSSSPSSDSFFSSSSGVDSLVQFQSTRTNRLRPVVFQPNGSFRALKENGKLRCEPHELELYRGRTKNPLANTVHQLPGYTGFVRGSQHVSGRTFGETTRRALSSDYKDLVRDSDADSAVPSVPQQNSRIPQVTIPDSFAHHMFGSRSYHIPGYTGHIPGVRAAYSSSYGRSTETELRKLRRTSQIGDAGETKELGFGEGYAKGAFAKQTISLDSAPLPGGAVANSPPNMFIPSHVRYLKYFPM